MLTVKIRIDRQVSKETLDDLGLRDGDIVEVTNNTDKDSVRVDSKTQENAIFIEYFKSLRDEIHLRIREHNRLVWIKIISLAVIISFLVGRFVGNVDEGQSSKFLLYLVWIIPGIAAIFDNLIGGNLRVISNLGDHIKSDFEESAFAQAKSSVPGFRFWEEKGARPGDYWHCYTRRDMLAIWLFTLVSWIVSILFRIQVGFDLWIDPVLAMASLIVVLLALLYLVRSTTVKRKEGSST
ncbi:hypothetical protein LM602_05165 [Candidatus Acetothermia bacterium]|jgi:bifunctional DNA-binding transcriptional regulator/antitoxin component of YhaV-PrlF toxin-antitoxin module|nr:hypothetical protein [Candidatus Acetothermia bacterium]MCI2431933.1 hypothetical protein [Candidatus Acetothermia bacterium]MCI2436614.1 hypothetical protein [Candidatus Acetothermia bacterium]